MWDSIGSTSTVGAGPDTGDCRQAYPQGGSAAVWSAGLESMLEEGLGFVQERKRADSYP